MPFPPRMVGPVGPVGPVAGPPAGPPMLPGRGAAPQLPPQVLALLAKLLAAKHAQAARHPQLPMRAPVAPQGPPMMGAGSMAPSPLR